VLWCQHHCGIWRSADNAASWQRIENVPVSNFGFAVAVHPGDGGRSFETSRAGLPASHCYDLVYRHGLAVADDGRTLLMGSTTGGLWASSDAGDRWTDVSAHLPPIYAVRLG